MKLTATPLAVFAALALCLPAAAQDAQQPAASVSQAGERLFAILLEPGPAWKPGRPFVEQGLGPHLEYWVALHRQGRIVTAGPLGDDSGLVVFYAADRQTAGQILNGDPAIKAGIFTGSVRPYAPPMVNAARLAAGQTEASD